MKELERYILDMKNTSELMLDLAYSALIYHDREIAKEVIELEDKINRLFDQIQKASLKNCEGEKIGRYIIMMRMSDSIERIADSALDIADVVLRDIDIHPVMKKGLEESDVFMVRKKISPGSMVDGKKIGDLKIASETGMWIIAIKRGRSWIYGPDEKDVLKGGDVIFARGPMDSEESLGGMIGGK